MIHNIVTLFLYYINSLKERSQIFNENLCIFAKVHVCTSKYIDDKLLISSPNSSMESKCLVTFNSSKNKLLTFNRHRAKLHIRVFMMNSCYLKESPCFKRLLGLSFTAVFR